MTDTNRLRLSAVRQSALGETLTTPRMRKARITGESLAYKPDYVDPDEIRDDRMNADPILVGNTNNGGIKFELSYPADGSFWSDVLASVFMNDWANTPSRDNDGTADSAITAVTASTQTVTVATGAAFVAGHLALFTGFTGSANNALRKVTTGGATAPAFLASGLVDEAAPPAAARIKVVGFEGAAGDITATATGLGSTALDFTTLGLRVGQWVKIGGTGAAYRFATAALNVYARITAIAANALTLDNLPTSWATDSGAGKTVRVFFGDTIKNGTTKIGMAIERGFMGQATPSYILQQDMVAGQLEISLKAKDKLTGSVEFMGLRGSTSTTSVDDTPDAAPTGRVMAAGANVGRIAENGAPTAGGNYIKGLTVKLNNNLRILDAADNMGGVDIGVGSCDVTVSAETYFGSLALLEKVHSGEITNLNFRAAKDNQALIFSFPRVTPADGNPNAGGKNQDVMLTVEMKASADALTNAHIILDRFEYVET